MIGPHCHKEIEQFRNRKEILKQLSKKPMRPTDLVKKLKLQSFGTIAYHLKQLENKGVVTKEKRKDEQGQPTYYSIKK